MEGGGDCCATQLIDGDGVFNVSSLENFVRTVNLAPCGLSYAVVAIMGPQSGGKSTLMNHLFHTSFREMDAFRGRVWSEKEGIRAIIRDVRSESLKLLSDMAAIRLDEKPNRIESVLHSSLIDITAAAVSSQNSIEGAATDPLVSSMWEEVSPKDTLIIPVQCMSLWREFLAETVYTVIQAISAQEACKRSNEGLPSPWTIMAMLNSDT